VFGVVIGAATVSGGAPQDPYPQHPACAILTTGKTTVMVLGDAHRYTAQASVSVTGGTTDDYVNTAQSGIARWIGPRDNDFAPIQWHVGEHLTLTGKFVTATTISEAGRCGIASVFAFDDVQTP
jgi:hypothetical protein